MTQLQPKAETQPDEAPVQSASPRPSHPVEADGGGRALREGIARTVVTVLLCAYAVISLTPTIWLIAAGVKPTDKLWDYDFFPPAKLLTSVNYHDLFTTTEFPRWMLNSVFTTSMSVIVQLFFSSLAGFALAKYNFKGRTLVMTIMLSTLMLPASVTMAPLYDELYHFHMIDNYAGLIVPGAVSVFGIFLFRQSILQIPDELLQAARLDGCSEFGIYWNIIMPVSRPMIGAFCMISFMGAWNNFLWPQILLHNSHLFTVPIGLNQLVGIYQNKYGMLMAGTLLGVLPVMLLFMALNKEFVAGLTSGAVKG